MRDKLSTAIGFGILALLLTAGAAQSLTGSNTVFSDDIVDGTISTADLKAGSISGSRLLNNGITGAKVFPNTLTGADVNENTLVPTCPANTTRAGDVCFGPEKPALDFQAAMGDCINAGMHLPTLSVGSLVADVTAGTDSLWADNAFEDDGADKEVIVLAANSYSYRPIAEANTYRCVTTVGARP